MAKKIGIFFFIFGVLNLQGLQVLAMLEPDEVRPLHEQTEDGPSVQVSLPPPPPIVCSPTEKVVRITYVCKTSPNLTEVMGRMNKLLEHRSVLGASRLDSETIERAFESPLHTVCLNVRHLGCSLEYYADHLGMNRVSTEPASPQSAQVGA